MRWDSLLVRHVARELHEALAGRRVQALRFDRERLVVSLRCGRITLHWDLSARGGGVHIVTTTDREAGNVPMPRPAVVSAVVAAADERVLAIRFASALPAEIDTAASSESADVVQAGARTGLGAAAPEVGAGELVIELISPTWNAIALGAGARIVAVLRPRRGARPLASGLDYQSRPRSARIGATTPISAREWRRILSDVPAEARERALLEHVAYTSPINSAHILGSAARSEDDYRTTDRATRVDATTAHLPAESRGSRPADSRASDAEDRNPSLDALARFAHAVPTPPPAPSPAVGSSPQPGDDRELDDAFARYHALVAASTPSPCVLHTPHGAQPYPFALDGMPCDPETTLLEAFDAAVSAGGQPSINATGTTAATLERVHRQLQRVNSRIARLRAELEGAASDATALRAQADLLLAQLHRVRRGDREVTLDDYAGGTVVVSLDPSVSAADNAQRLYEAARKRERAARRVPAILRRAEADAKNLRELAARLDAGTASPGELEPAPRMASRSAKAAERRLPYRRYRTSGGIEVRVGRSAADGDELTLRHSSPNDIWLHAREVAGAHVVLRWPDREANPPAADLREAAILAAVHSRARTSATVPVDWTRRKYVRKPRKAKPGLVVIERAKTLFVEPSESLEKRLRVEHA